MVDFQKRAMHYLAEKADNEFVIGSEFSLVESQTLKPVKKYSAIIGGNFGAAVLYRMIAVAELGSDDEVDSIAYLFPGLIQQLLDGPQFNGLSTENSHVIHSHQMVHSPRVIVYTDSLKCQPNTVLEAFGRLGHLIELIEESELEASSPEKSPS